jgi:hypothetical protein
LRNRIAGLAAAGAVSFSAHAFAERSPQRSIDINEALRVLKLGDIEGPVEPGVNAGEWKCKVVARAERSSRRIGVVTVVIRNARLLIVTVEWEDR